uniref:Ornithine cyclodeaminase n=1 Tax=Ipomoea batatas TaxID=4120 RepID=A0A0F6NM56_IPOBA|nr:hypothetical protein [Ipomoea batatas]
MENSISVVEGRTLHEISLQRKLWADLTAASLDFCEDLLQWSSCGNVAVTDTDLDRVVDRVLYMYVSEPLAYWLTGWFALACMNLLLQGKRDIEVFVFGAGPVAEAAILSLDHGAAHRILCVSVLSRHGISNQMLAAKLASKVHFKLDAVKDRTRLHRAGFVITATDAGAPLFEPHEISRNAVTLSLGIDDMPAEYFEMLFSQGGLAVGDDLVAMEARNVDPLSLYYSRRGLKLTEHGRADGVKNYSEILSDATLMERLKNWKGPASFLPVGLASLDVAVAAKIYEMLSITLSTKE